MGLFRVLFDVVDGIAYGSDLLSLVIGDGDAEFLLEFHDEFYSVQRIGSQVVREAGLVLYFGFFMQFQT